MQHTPVKRHLYSALQLSFTTISFHPKCGCRLTDVSCSDY